MDVTSELKYNDSISELSKEDLQSELLKFKSTCKDYQEIIENRNQEVHVLKRQVISLLSLEQEYEQEIYYITSAESKKFKVLRDRIHELESAPAEISSQNSDELASLQNECQNLRKTVADLQEKLNTTPPSIDRGEFDTLVEENEDLKSKYKYFVHTRHPITLQELQEQREQVKELTEELDDIRNTYTSNSANTKAKLDEQEEQIASMRIELSNARTAQQNTQEETHEARGNSMFSEVHDKWISLKKNNEHLVKAYQEVRLERNKLRNESSLLRKENASMYARWRTEGIEARRNDSDLINTSKFAYEKLEDLVKEYEEELAKERNINYNMPDTNAGVYMNMIKAKNEQIDKLYKEFRQANGSTIIHRMEVREINSKARKYLSEATQYKSDVEQLREQLKELQHPNTQTNQADTSSSENNIRVLSIEQSEDRANVGLNKLQCACQFRKPMCDVATMTVIDRIRTRAIPSKLVVQTLNDTSQNGKEHLPDEASLINATHSKATIGEVVNFEDKYGDDNTKENDSATRNIASDAKREVRKVQFAEDVSASFVNEQRRRPRPRGKPIDCSQMIVIKRQSPTKL